MPTPLFDAVQAYINKKTSRFHMPGHKGALPYPLDTAAAFDVTEIAGTDSLYEASGVIAELEREYAGIYGTAASLLSAGGSTLCIQAMLALCLSPGSSLVCGRGAHISAINAMALLDLHPVWVCPDIDNCGLAGEISPAAVDAALRENPGAKAVYITSPNYYGAMSDIKGIAGICRIHGVPLLVDNAHGAHLKFLPESALYMHPMDLGADMCADSLHKTLPVLTGGAMLHIKNPAYTGDAKRRMSLFGSTSPSYLIMLSCGMVLDYLKNNAREDIRRIAGETARLKGIAAERGFLVPRGLYDPMRLTLGFRETGYTEKEFWDHIRSNGLEPEYLSENFCVFLMGPGNTEADFRRLEKAITELPKKPPVPSQHLAGGFPKPYRALSIREAVFADSEAVSVNDAAGRIASGTVSPCPPGIPLIVPGERIDAAALPYLKGYGILEIYVIK